MQVVRVDDGNIGLLKMFVGNIGSAATTFRYFLKRDISVIRNHLVTLLLMLDDVPVAYGHLEKELNTTWLGICVLPGYSGKGYGKKMMNELIKNGKELGIKEIFLSVDKINIPAIELYRLFNFKEVEAQPTYFKFKLNLD